MNGVREGKGFVGRTAKKDSGVKGLTPENIESKEKIESDLQKAKIREKDVQQEFRKRLVSAESIQVLEGTAGKFTEDESRKYS